MQRTFNVLISSAGRRVALVEIFRRTLEHLGLSGSVLAADMSRLSSAAHSADRAFLVPPCSSDDFVPSMLEICAANGVGLIVPTLDPELPIYAEHRDRFAEIGTTVAISSPEAVAIAWDKGRTRDWLVANGFPTVHQATPEEVLSGSNGSVFPAVVKPRVGSASIGFSVVNDLLELEFAVRSGGFIVQSLAPGHEHTVDVLVNSSGRAVCAVPRRRIEVRAGEVSKGVTVRSPKLEELARSVCDALPGAYGPITVQIFHDDSSGESNVIEINPRFGGGFL